MSRDQIQNANLLTEARAVLFSGLLLFKGIDVHDSQLTKRLKIFGTIVNIVVVLIVAGSFISVAHARFTRSDPWRPFGEFPKQMQVTIDGCSAAVRDAAVPSELVQCAKPWHGATSISANEITKVYFMVTKCFNEDVSLSGENGWLAVPPPVQSTPLDYKAASGSKVFGKKGCKTVVFPNILGPEVKDAVRSGSREFYLQGRNFASKDGVTVVQPWETEVIRLAL